MALKLQYPIKATHENLAFRKDKQVMAYYRIPNTPITITDDEKKGKHKITVSQMLKKLAKNQHFDISLIPKDISWKKRCVTLWMLSHQIIKHLVKTCCSTLWIS